MEAMQAAMTPAERADPLGMSESRRMELATAANVPDDEVSYALHAYEMLSKMTRGRGLQSWEYVVLQAYLWLMLPLLVIAAGGRFIMQKIGVRKFG
jgi:hypothetical protein